MGSILVNVLVAIGAMAGKDRDRVIPVLLKQAHDAIALTTVREPTPEENAELHTLLNAALSQVETFVAGHFANADGMEGVPNNRH